MKLSVPGVAQITILGPNNLKDVDAVLGSKVERPVLFFCCAHFIAGEPAAKGTSFL